MQSVTIGTLRCFRPHSLILEPLVNRRHSNSQNDMKSLTGGASLNRLTLNTIQNYHFHPEQSMKLLLLSQPTAPMIAQVKDALHRTDFTFSWENSLHFAAATLDTIFFNTFRPVLACFRPKITYNIFTNFDVFESYSQFFLSHFVRAH